MEFTEDNRTFATMPKWMRFLIDFGYGWPATEATSRRICLVSMPCDSAGAGLVALGALVRDLGNPHANDIDGHYDRLLAYARQYLESCRACKLRCKPEQKRCGFTGEATGKLRSLKTPHFGYLLSGSTNFHERQISFARNGVTFRPFPQCCTDYYIDGEPPPKWDRSEGALSAERFSQLVAGCQIHLDNLRRSYSGLCLAGRTGGGNASREICASVRFRNGTEEEGLDELITVHDWSACKVSRIAFYNARTGELDRNVVAPRLVVADGDASFLKVSSETDFHQSDIVGVIHRMMERDRLEALGEKMSALRQWYVQDEDMLCGLPEVPRGVSISILRKRV